MQPILRFVSSRAQPSIDSSHFSAILSRHRDKLRLPATISGSPQMLEQGVWAEVIVGKEHLRLFSEETPLGFHASVYNVNEKKWIAPSEPVQDIDQGKDRAAAHAAAYLSRVANSDLPPLNWKKSRSA
jgi:hypothetical protein